MTAHESMILSGQLVMLEYQFDDYITQWHAGCWTGAEWQAGVLTDNPAQAVIRDGDTLINADLRPGRNLAIGEQATGQRYIVHGDGVSGRGPVAVPIRGGGMNNSRHARFALIAGQLYPAGGLANNAALIAALTAAGVQSAPLVDGSGRWFGYEIHYHRPGKTWGPGGYLATRESRDWTIL